MNGKSREVKDRHVACWILNFFRKISFVFKKCGGLALIFFFVSFFFFEKLQEITKKERKRNEANRFKVNQETIAND